MFKFNSPEDRVILSADGLGLPGDSGDSRASKLVKLAETVGASTVTIGPDIATGSGWSWIHDLMENAGVDWMADTGISSDDPNVISRVVSTLVNFKYPPIAMHIGSGDAPMEAALRETEGSGTDILGIVDSGLLGEREHYNTTGYSPQDSLRNLAIRASKVGLSGIVGSPSDMCVLPPGLGIVKIARCDKPAYAYRDYVAPQEAIYEGADAVIVGSGVANSEDPSRYFQGLVDRILLIRDN